MIPDWLCMAGVIVVGIALMAWLGYWLAGQDYKFPRDGV